MRATLLFIRQSILVHKIANKIRFIFAISLLIFSFSLKSQSNFNNGIDRLITFEPLWGGYSYTFYAKKYGAPENINVSLLYFKPRVSLYVTKNLELGISATTLRVKSNNPDVLPGKAKGLGYFIRYNLPALNFSDSVRLYSKRFAIEGSPFVEFDHDYSSLGLDSVTTYIFSPSLRFRQFDFKVGCNFKLYKSIYSSIFLAYNISPDYESPRRDFRINMTLGFAINRRKK